MSSAASRITEFVLTKLPGETVAKRIQLNRDLASLAASPKEAKRFNDIADHLAAGEAEARQLLLDFQRGAL